jgi:trk system potassium uptake protein TrkA
VLALTNDDQVNILTNMLALREGCQRGLCLINDNSFQNLAGDFGMEVSINPRAITVSSVLRHVRLGNVLQVHALSDESAEMIEAEIQEGAPITGSKLRDIDFGTSMRVGAVYRKGKIIMPRGGTEFKQGDRIIMFVTADGIEAFENLLLSKEKK